MILGYFGGHAWKYLEKHAFYGVDVQLKPRLLKKDNFIFLIAYIFMDSCTTFELPFNNFKENHQ